MPKQQFSKPTLQGITAASLVLKALSQQLPSRKLQRWLSEAAIRGKR